MSEFHLLGSLSETQAGSDMLESCITTRHFDGMKVAKFMRRTDAQHVPMCVWCIYQHSISYAHALYHAWIVSNITLLTSESSLFPKTYHKSWSWSPLEFGYHINCIYRLKDLSQWIIWMNKNVCINKSMIRISNGNTTPTMLMSFPYHVPLRNCPRIYLKTGRFTEWRCFSGNL